MLETQPTSATRPAWSRFAWNVVNQDERVVARARVEVLWRRDGAAAELDGRVRRQRLRPDPAVMPMLEGKKLLITGVINRDSIAFDVARQAQEAGAEVVLTGFGRAKRMTERAAARLPEPPDVLELDVNEPEHLEALAAELRERWGRVDGVLHAIAFAPEDALGGRFLTTPPESAATAFQTSAYSFKALAAALEDLFPEEGASDRRAGLRRAGRLAGLRLDGRGQGGAGGGQPLPGARPRPARRAREPRLRRPARDARRARHPRLRRPRRRRGSARRRSAGTPRTRRRSPARCCSCSATSRAAITGEVLHVDGGFHAMGTALVPDGATAAEREPETEPRGPRA